MWVDASVEMKPARYRGAPRLAVSTIRYINPSTNAWKELATLNNLPLGRSPVIEAEMVAIHEAFRVACKLHNDFDCLVIFSDSQSVMQGLKSKGLFSYLSTPCWLTNIFTYANQLYDFGIIAELQWVLAHSKIKGNDIVDKIARAVRISAQLILAKEQPNLALSHVSITLNTAGALRQVLFSVGLQIDNTTDKFHNKFWKARNFDIEKDSTNGKTPDLPTPLPDEGAPNLLDTTKYWANPSRGNTIMTTHQPNSS